MIMFVVLGFRDAVFALPTDRTEGVDLSKLYQELIDAFYAYECHLKNFVLDRDMPNVIYSLDFVPVSSPTHS